MHRRRGSRSWRRHISSRSARGAGLPRRLALLELGQAATGNWIAEDDFDGEYRYAGRPLAPLRALDRSGRVAYLGSFSKLLFPALRLSFVVLPASASPRPLNGS